MNAPNADTPLFFAVAAPGTEGLLYDEISDLGAANAIIVEGGVEFGGDLETLYRVNLWSRLASRVVRRLATFPAVSFPELHRKTRNLPWDIFVRRGDGVDVRSTAHASRLTMKRKIEDVVFTAIRDRVAGVEKGEDQLVLVRFLHNACTVSADTSGELLHKRGYRELTTAAPLRETLAATILRLAEYDPHEPLVDPMCGSGTMALEAALIALDRAPGRERVFRFFRHRDFDARLWQRLIADADSRQRRTPPAPILAADQSGGALAAAHGNRERAGLEAAVEIVRANINQVRAPNLPGLVVLDPPYGRRMRDGDPGAVYDTIGHALKARFAGWRFALLAPDFRLFQRARLRYEKRHTLFHGGQRVELFVGRIAAK
ncbi:class I SAM-dependent RNA methyltransferase [bacterium]|nr:class I SAM-dependent RNA methyltransferase [bacterium]